MPHLKLIRLAGAAIILASMPLVAASAQTQTPPSPNAATDTAPNGPMTKPANPADNPSTARRRTDKSGTAPAKAHPPMVLVIMPSHGNNVGTVRTCNAAPDGSGQATLMMSGGFLPVVG